MEKVIMEKGLWVEYTGRLGMDTPWPDRRVIHANATAKCEAALRTLNLWTEGDA